MEERIELMEPIVKTADLIARERIEHARIAQAPTLVLGDLNITQVPESIAQLAQLEELDLASVPVLFDGCDLRELPACIGDLHGLHMIDASGNPLTWLPASIGRLADLKSLDVSMAHLRSLPGSIGRLARLEDLNLGVNELDELPETFGDLHALRHLDLSENHLVALPESMRGLDHLETLFLHGNPVLGLPDEVLGPTLHEVQHGATPASPMAILDEYFRSHVRDA